VDESVEEEKKAQATETTNFGLVDVALVGTTAAAAGDAVGGLLGGGLVGFGLTFASDRVERSFGCLRRLETGGKGGRWSKQELG
jgi:hypothetical protein